MAGGSAEVAAGGAGGLPRQVVPAAARAAIGAGARIRAARTSRPRSAGTAAGTASPGSAFIVPAVYPHVPPASPPSRSHSTAGSRYGVTRRLPQGKINHLPFPLVVAAAHREYQ